MKHLRLATILIFGIISLSLPAMAQTENYFFNDAKTSLVLYVSGSAKASRVAGSYELNGNKCLIGGSYFPTTGRLKARCQNNDDVLNVTGFKLTNQDAFQLTIGSYTYVARPVTFGVSGTWHIQQNGGGRSYEGNLYLKIESADSFTGTAAWNNHQQGKVAGKYHGEGGERYVTFTIYYSEGLEGYYKATLSPGGDDMVDGTARANKGGPVVSWIAKRVSR